MALEEAIGKRFYLFAIVSKTVATNVLHTEEKQKQKIELSKSSVNSCNLNQVKGKILKLKKIDSNIR